MKNKEYYVILTGSKNNAGDFLIKYRAKALLNKLRPDREIIDLDGWKLFDEATLKLVNGAKALILMGGPALQKNMYPDIYPLVDDLSKITTRIAFMGIGWKSLCGNWSDTQNYPLSEKTISLLNRVALDGLTTSVRDYHTLNVLNSYGYHNIIMTGCPASYVEERFNEPVIVPEKIKNVSFSLGVSFLFSKKMELQMKETILKLKEYFRNSDRFEVVFHHSTDTSFLKTHNATNKHLSGHLNFINWLKDNDISYVDISGSAENLIDHYSDCDVHIGYRVHAHIFMTSISKLSMLIAEDGRGKALKDVFGGIVFDGFESIKKDIYSKVLNKLKLRSSLVVNEEIPNEILNTLDYEIGNSLPRLGLTRSSINCNYRLMKKFVLSLP